VPECPGNAQGWEIFRACPCPENFLKGVFIFRANRVAQLPEYCPDKIVSFGQAADTTKGGGFRRPDFTCESSYRVRRLFVYQPPVGGGFMRLRSGGTFDAPTWFFQRNPPLHSIQPWGFPRPRPNLPLGLPHSRAGFSSARRARRKVFRRSNGGDWTEWLTRNRLEHSPPRRHYFTPRLFLQTRREVNDETRSYHNRNCGHFGSDRLGGGGECTIWRSGPSLRPCTSLRPCASLWPFSKVCPSSLSSLCSSDLSCSDLWRSELWRSPCGLWR